jgi:hypothetical protein
MPSSCHKVAERFCTTQIEAGVRRATESAVHAARRYIGELRQRQAFLKLNFKNAFNSINRNVILQSVFDELPELYPLCMPFMPMIHI